MKKIISLMLVLLLLLVGCTTGQPSDVKPAEQNEKPAEEKTNEQSLDEEYDVVVVGAGLGGLAAALRAAENGSNVVLLEKLGFAGGNSLLSTGVIYAGDTSLQEKQGIEDSPEAFYKEAMDISNNKRNELQTHMVADYGRETIDWLISNGVEFSDKITAVLGSNTPRGHQALPNASGLITPLLEKAESAGVKVMFETPATSIIEESGSVVGVIAKNKNGEEITLKAKSVIIATGGYGADYDRLVKYTPKAEGLIYSGSPGTTGEMLDEMIRLGANTIELEEPWLTPTIEVNKKLLITSLVLSKGGVLVDNEGNRFTNETAPYTDVSNVVLGLGQEYIYEILDGHIKEAVYKVPEYIDKGMILEADTLEKLAEETGLPLDNLKATIEDYNSVIRGEKEDAFGREIYVEELKAPFYYAKVSPGTIMTPGGVEINENCQVVKADGKVINGLYAIGETTGGYRAFGYRGGDSLAHAVVTGYISGYHAATNK